MARLNAGTLAVAVVAILLALTGAFAVRQFLEGQQARTAESSEPAEADLVKVPVAVTDLDHGRVIRESDFTEMKLSRDAFAKTEYAKIAFIGRIDHLTGRVLREPIKAGKSVGPEQLYTEGTGPTVAEKLPAGMRAVTVKVSGAGFADGFASPGTFVDVLFRSAPEKSGTSGTPETTITALDNIQVLAVDVNPYPNSGVGVTQNSGNDAAQEARVTFAVAPSQATMLKALEDRGEISLALRPLPEIENAVAHSEPEEPQERHAQTVQQILEGVKATPIAVAMTELVEGRVIRPGDIRLLEGDKVDEELGDAATFGDVEALVGRVTRSELKAGQAITAAALYPEGVGPGVADRLAPGFRAVTVKMDEAALIDGFVSPGTEVDVFFRANKIEGYPETTLRVLDGLEVLAIEDRVAPGSASGDDNDGLRVTLAVPLGDVGRIQALEGHGAMTLAVRAANERPIGDIIRELDKTTRDLEKTQKQVAALREISDLGDSISLSKEQSERLATLVAEIPQLERRIQSLNEERDAATSGVSQTTLTEVLNLPEPSRPATLELYNGGARQTLVFDSTQQILPSSRTASRGDAGGVTGVKNTSAKTKVNKPVSGVKKSATGAADIDKVSLILPGKKVSEARSENAAGRFATKGSRRDSQRTSILTSVKNFGKELVAGLSQARQSTPRVEIVRGGVKD